MWCFHQVRIAFARLYISAPERGGDKEWEEESQKGGR